MLVLFASLTIIAEAQAAENIGASNRTTANFETLEIAQVDQRAQIQRLQLQLTDLGYSSGGADGVMGPNTQRAIASFQRDAGLTVNGLPTAETLASIQAVWSMRGGPGLSEAAPSIVTTQPITPSFNCALAGNASERAICSSSDLAQLDRQMAETFQRAMAGRSADEVRAQQRSWLRNRNQCGSNVMCLADSMRQRIQVLSIYAGGSTTSPNDRPQIEPGQATLVVPPNAFAMPGSDILELNQPNADTETAPSDLQRPQADADSLDGPIGNGGDLTGTEHTGAVSIAPADIGLPVLQGLPSYFLGFVARDERFADDDAIAERHAQLHLRMALSADVTPEMRQAQQIAALGYLEMSAIEQTFLSLMGEMPRTWASLINQQPSAARLSAVLSQWMTPGQSPVATHTEFQARRFAQAFLPQADQWMARAALPVRQRVLFVCPFALPGYDFEVGSFELDVEQVRGDCRGLRQNTTLASVPMPGSVDADPAVGERLSAAQLERGRLLLTFPGILSIRPAADERGNVTIQFTIEPEGPFSMVRGANADDVLYTFSQDELVMPPLTAEEQAAADLANFDRPWGLGNEAEREVLLQRATPLPEIAPGIASMFAQTTGLLLRSSTTLDHASVAQEARNMANFYLPQHRGHDRDVVAERFGVDVDQVLALSDAVISGSSGIRAFLLFAAPLDEFPPQPLPPLQPDSNSTPVSIDYRVTAEYRYTEPGGRDVLVFAVQPEQMTSFVRRARYNEETRLYEDVTLGSVSLLPAALRQFAQRQISQRSDILHYLALQQGASLADFAFEAYTRARVLREDPFARRELAVDLARQLGERPTPDGRFQLVQSVTLGDYDFETQSYPIRLEGNIRVAEDDSILEQLAVGWGLEIDRRNIRLPVPPESARMLQASGGYIAIFDVTATGLWVQNGDPAINTTLDSITLLRANADLRVDNPTDTVLRFDYGAWQAEQTRAASQEQESGDQAAFNAAMSTFDILGVQLGSDFEASLATLRSRMPDADLYLSNRELRLGAGTAAGWEPHQEAALLHNRETDDAIAIYHEPPSASDVVTAVTRTRVFAPGTGPTTQSIYDQLAQRYGDPFDFQNVIGQDQKFFFWLLQTMEDERELLRPDVQGCTRSLKAKIAVSLTNFILSEQAIENGVIPQSAKPWGHIENDELYVPSTVYPVSPGVLSDGDEHCRFVVFALWIDEDTNGRVRLFRSALINPEQLHAIVEANRTIGAEQSLESEPVVPFEL